MLKLYVVDIEESITNGQYTEWLDKITDDQRTRITQFRFAEDAKRTLYGDILVRHLICQRLHIENKDIVIERNAYGKPFLRGYPVFCYNISHAGKWVICAVCDQQVGVDIEQIKPINLEVAKRFFTKNEYNEIMVEPKINQLNTFYHLWTANESYIKYIGKGLSIPLDSFFVLKKKLGIYKVDIDEKCTIKTLENLEGYIISICYHAILEQQLDLKYMKMKEIKL